MVILGEWMLRKPCSPWKLAEYADDYDGDNHSLSALLPFAKHNRNSFCETAQIENILRWDLFFPLLLFHDKDCVDERCEHECRWGGHHPDQTQELGGEYTSNTSNLQFYIVRYLSSCHHLEDIAGDEICQSSRNVPQTRDNQDSEDIR